MLTGSASFYVEAVRAAHGEIGPFFREAIRDAGSARDALVALTRAYADAYDRFPTLTRFLSGIPVEMHRYPEIASALMADPNTVLQLIAEIVERGVETGEIDRERSGAVTSMYLSSTIGFSLHAAFAGKAGLDDAVDAFTRLLDGRLFGNGPAKSRTGDKTGKTRKAR